MTDVYIFGTWHQGLVISAVLADSGFFVTCLTDDDEDKKLNSLVLPIFEPGLDDLIEKGLVSGKLRFRPKFSFKTNKSSVVIFAHDIEVDVHDKSDLDTFYSDLDLLLNSGNTFANILITSQVPMGTYNSILEKYKNSTVDLSLRIAVLPENLRLGNAIERFRCPPLPVIGCSLTEIKFWKDFFKWTRQDFYFCSQTEAELLKHALNGYLALNIAFGNEIYRLGNNLDADGRTVMNLLKLEPRVGNLAPIRPGLPFFGGTLARDLTTMKHIQAESEQQLNLPIITHIIKSNDEHMDFMINKIVNYPIFKSKKNITVCILGLTYTIATSTLRKSPGEWLTSELVKRGISVRAFDPRILPSDLTASLTNDISLLKNYKFDCFILLSPWPKIEELIDSIVSDEFFIDIDGWLTKLKVGLPKNYQVVFNRS